MKGAKEIEFYQKIISRNNEFIKEHEKMINFITSNIENISSSLLAYFIWHLNNLIANYSIGSSKEELRKQFSECVTVMEKVWNKKITKVYHGKKQEELNQYRFEPYLYMLQMISLGILLDVPDDEFKILVNLIDRDNIKDHLLEFLISYRLERKQINSESYSRYLLIPKLFSPLVEITKTIDKIDAEAKIKKYLEKEWIKIPKNHFLNFKLSDIKEYDVNSGFVGLWAFEVAAIVKIKKLSDEAFINNMFYPDKLR